MYTRQGLEGRRVNRSRWACALLAMLLRRGETDQRKIVNHGGADLVVPLKAIMNVILHRSIKMSRQKSTATAFRPDPC